MATVTIPSAQDASTPLLPSSTLKTVETEQGGSYAVKNCAHGYMFMVLSAVCQSLMSFFVRVAEASYNYPSISSVMVRSFTSITLSLIYLYAHGLLHKLKLTRKQFAILSFRGLFGASAGTCCFFAMNYLPVGTTMTILYAYPAFTFVLAAIFLHDPFTPLHLLTLTLNFIGVALTSSDSYFSHNGGGHFALIGVAYAVLAAFFGATVLIFVRVLGFRVHFVLNCMFYGLGCIIVVLCFGSRDDVIAITANPKGTLFALLSGLAGFGSQSMLTRSVQLVKPGPASIVGSLSVPASFVLGLVFLSEHPSPLSMLGVCVVLISVAIVAWQKHRVDRRQSPPHTVPDTFQRTG